MARAVERNVTAAIGFMQFNAIGGKELTRSNNVLCSGIPAQRDYLRMFQQKQRVADASFFHQADERLLQLQRNGIVHAAEIKDVDDAKGHTLIVAISKWQLAISKTRIAKEMAYKFLGSLRPSRPLR